MPLRLAHWTFVVCIAGAWLTRGGERADLHAVFGYAALGVLALRIAWGFVGPTHARFASFAYSPREAAHYVRSALAGSARHYTGHNPAGSWSVWLLLSLIALACVSGVIASSGMHQTGLLGDRVDFIAGDVALRIHEAFAWVILAVAALHLLGVAWGSLVHRENLAVAMVTGRKRAYDGSAAETPSRTGVAASLLAIVVGASALYLAWQVPRDTARRESREATARAALASTAWGKECGSCHLAYSPALLPLRAWERTLREQDRHFGEDLSLSAAAIERLMREAQSPAISWATWKISTSIPPGEAPLAVTQLPAWKHMHERVEAERFKPPYAAGPHECEACHRDAASGIFHARMIQRAKPRTTH